MIDETGPIQILELDADGTLILKIRNKAGRGFKWKQDDPTTDLETALTRFRMAAPNYVPEPVRRAMLPSIWKRFWGVCK